MDLNPTSESEVWAQVINDLNEAAKRLPKGI
jgi:hypothetical protein